MQRYACKLELTNLDCHVESSLIGSLSNLGCVVHVQKLVERSRPGMNVLNGARTNSQSDPAMLCTCSKRRECMAVHLNAGSWAFINWQQQQYMEQLTTKCCDQNIIKCYKNPFFYIIITSERYTLSPSYCFTSY